MSDIYQPYREMLAGKSVPIHAEHPYPGRYKLKRGEVWLPVAIGQVNGEIAAIVDGKPANALEIWTYCAKHPVTQDAYKARMANGHWPDEPAPAARPNMPSDPFEALRAEVDDKCTQAAEWLDKTPSVADQTACDLARNMQAQLLALNKRADAMHKGEKEPVLEQAKTIDEKFRFRVAVKELSDRLRQRFEAFMRAEERRLQQEAEARFRAERERAEAERARLIAERAQLLRDDPIAGLTSDEPELPAVPTAPEPVKVSAGGGFGRKAGLKTVKHSQVFDHAAALAFFADSDEVKDLVCKLAQKAMRAGVKVPGARVVEERVAA